MGRFGLFRSFVRCCRLTVSLLTLKMLADALAIEEPKEIAKMVGGRF